MVAQIKHQILLAAVTMAHLFVAPAAFAGTVVLISDTWDNICRVEVTTGINAPNTSVQPFSGVRPGRVTSGTDRLCYRRSNDPRNCSSGLTEWRCSAKLTSGTENFSLR